MNSGIPTYGMLLEALSRFFLPIYGITFGAIAVMEGVRTSLPEPIGNTVGIILGVGGTCLFSWYIMPVRPKETS